MSSSPDGERVVPWQDVLPGDAVRGADTEIWIIDVVVPRRGDITMRRVDGSRGPLVGHPHPRSVVAVLPPITELRRIVETFAAADLPAHYEKTEETKPNV